jgi:hypothetical protein
MRTFDFNPLWFIPLIPLAILIIFPLFWCFVVWMISLIGGWQRLAERYRAQQPASGKKWFSQYGYVNRARYRNALNLATNDAGVFIEVMPIFRFCHPPLFIPWRELHNPRNVVYRRRWPLVQVDVGAPPQATLSLPAAVFADGEGYAMMLDAAQGQVDGV